MLFNDYIFYVFNVISPGVLFWYNNPVRLVHPADCFIAKSIGIVRFPSAAVTTPAANTKDEPDYKKDQKYFNDKQGNKE